MAKVPETMADGTRRVEGLQQVLQALADRYGYSQEIMDATDHPYSCTCDKCLAWWREIGPDDDGTYGPFGAELPQKGIDEE